MAHEARYRHWATIERYDDPGMAASMEVEFRMQRQSTQELQSGFIPDDVYDIADDDAALELPEEEEEGGEEEETVDVVDGVRIGLHEHWRRTQEGALTWVRYDGYLRLTPAYAPPPRHVFVQDERGRLHYWPHFNESLDTVTPDTAWHAVAVLNTPHWELVRIAEQVLGQWEDEPDPGAVAILDDTDEGAEMAAAALMQDAGPAPVSIFHPDVDEKALARYYEKLIALYHEPSTADLSTGARSAFDISRLPDNARAMLQDMDLFVRMIGK